MESLALSDDMRSRGVTRVATGTTPTTLLSDYLFSDGADRGDKGGDKNKQEGMGARFGPSYVDEHLDTMVTLLYQVRCSITYAPTNQSTHPINPFC